MADSAMSFLALLCDVEAADCDRWSDALLDAGALSVEAIDPRAGTVDETAVFADPVDGEPVWWPTTRLTALCDASVAPAVIVQAAADSIARKAPAVETFAVAERDWVRAPQAQVDLRERRTTGPKPPLRSTSGSRMSPPIAVRAKTRVAGETSRTATRISR